MKRTLAALIARAHRLETTIAGGVERAARRASGEPPREPLEIVHAIVETVGREVEPAGRGRQVFPFNHIRVAIVAPTPRAKARLQVAVDGPPSLEERIAARLESADCAAPVLDVAVSFVGRPGRDWSEREFDVTCARIATETASRPQAARLDLTVTHGVASRQRYTFATSPIAIGRGGDVRDSRHRLLRTNDVVFAEGGGDVNTTVSRRHARIEREATRDAFRIFDDGSARGTSVIRNGRGFPVPQGSRGMRLQSGDEIALGDARVRVTIHRHSGRG